MNKPEQKPFSKFSYPKKTVNFILTFAFGLVMALGFAWLISLTSTSPCPPDPKRTLECIQVVKAINIIGFFKNINININPLYLSLVLAGALGGLLYSILLDGELELPSWSKKNPNNLNPGFLAEIFVGISGAFIAYSVLPQELKQRGEQGLEITIFVTGLVGGYGGKAILDAALEKVMERIKTADLAKEKAESQCKELEEKIHIRNLVNQQIQNGLNQSELSEMQEKLEGATDDVKKIVFNIAHDARSLGRRTLTFKDRLSRTIPIFEALVASDNNNPSYNAELGYAYISSQPPDLDKAISYLDRAIELRIPGASTEGWKYEMNRAIARIGLGNSQSRDDILKDLFAVEQRKGLAQAIDEYERDGVDGGNNSIKNWLIQNQDWLSQQTNGKALLDEIQISEPAKPVTSTLSVTQNREDLVAAPPNTKIKATIKTYLKKQPIDSSELGENEKKEVPAGKEYKVLKYSEGIDGHCLVQLDYGAGTWYLWSAHWHLPWQESSKDNSLSSVSAPESSQHQGVNLVTRQQAESVYGRKMSDQQFNDLNSCLQRFEINTVPRIRHFLSQTAHESGGLQYMTEIWGPSQVPAQRTYDPPYPKAKELGNTKIGEGKKYRGAGAIQLTGKYNYQAFSRFINDSKVMDGADYVGANYPFTSAGFWWKNKNMNALCDRGGTVREVTKKVNGGYNGLADRQRYYDKACQVIKELPSTPLHTEELAAQPETGKAARESSDQVSKVEVVKESPLKHANPAVQRQIDRLTQYLPSGKTLNLETKTRYFSQRDNYRDAHRTCNSSSNAMYLDWLLRMIGKPGLDSDDGYLKKVFSIGDSPDHSVQTKAIKLYGFNTKWMTDRDTPFVEDLVEAGFPVVVNILHKGPITNPSGGHIIMLIDQKAEDWIAHDPWGTLTSQYKEHKGEYSRISKQEFNARWQGGYRILA
ncbi:C39 family peptidase [Microcystis aeruginosa]|uniref:C39 family peptidase n=1 Tax=Microcystis aeruginosa TaxID=1126 RepID=UPI001D13847C|nr:C39 family peptidase [Microcystis aeruginosa]